MSHLAIKKSSSSVIEGACALHIDASGKSVILGDHEKLQSVDTRIDSDSITVTIHGNLERPLLFSADCMHDINLVVNSEKKAQIVIGPSLSSRWRIELANRTEGDIFCWPTSKKMAVSQSWSVMVEQEARLRFFELGLADEKTSRGIDAVLHGEHAHMAYFGVDQLQGDAQKSSTLAITHKARRSTSKQSFRGVYGGNAKARFLGKVIVEQAAASCKAEQLYKSILLSEQAHAYVMPELEIHNSDVSASHGASIGELDAASLFYLGSRGLSLADAKALLILSLLDDIFDEITEPSIKNAVRQLFLTNVQTTMVRS